MAKKESGTRSIRDAITVALDQVSYDGDEHVRGSEIFWSALKEDGLSIDKALSRALWSPKGIGSREVKQGRKIFWETFRTGRSEAAEGEADDAQAEAAPDSDE